MRSVLRAVRLLTLVVWVGGLIFFAFVVAPVAFRTLPGSHQAGLVVGASLRVLHWMGLSAGAVFLLASAVVPKSNRWWVAPLLVTSMLLLTGISQWMILPSMEEDRAAAGGDIALVDVQAPARVHFDRLHRLSEQVEGGVLLLGLGACLLFSLERYPRDL